MDSVIYDSFYQMIFARHINGMNLTILSLLWYFLINDRIETKAVMKMNLLIKAL